MVGLLLAGLFFHVEVNACKINKKTTEKVFVASSTIKFSDLMLSSMEIMDSEMQAIDLNQTHELVFLKNMIAHHQGALNMASAIIINTKNKEITNYAISIITSQRNEIEYMKVLLKSLEKKATASLTKAPNNIKTN